MEALKHKPAKQ